MPYVSNSLPTGKLSATQIDLFRQCPEKYRYRYIAKTPAAGPVERKHLNFGNTVHAVFERYVKERRMPDRPSYEILRELYAEEAKRMTIPQTVEFEAKAERAFRWASKTLDFADTVCAEQRFVVEIAGYPVTGFIDRVDALIPGGGTNQGVSIRDYKTGKPTPDKYARERHEVQLGIYCFAAAELYDVDPTTVVTALEFVCDGEVLEMRFNQDALDHVEWIVRTTGEAIEALVAENPEAARKKPSPLCGWCEWNSICDAYSKV